MQRLIKATSLIAIATATIGFTANALTFELPIQEHMKVVSDFESPVQTENKAAFKIGVFWINAQSPISNQSAPPP